MQKNIKVNYSKLLRDPIEFEHAISRAVSLIPPYINQDSTLARYTSDVYFSEVKNSDIPISKCKNLKEFTPSIAVPIIRFLAELYPGCSIMPTGYFLYPITGYMSWHTNSDTIGKRVYITYVDQINKSGFKYFDGSEIVNSVDTEEITVRAFDIEKEKPLWHAVYSNCNRYSFGFRVVSLR